MNNSSIKITPFSCEEMAANPDTWSLGKLARLLFMIVIDWEGRFLRKASPNPVSDPVDHLPAQRLAAE